ncbi:nitroreductase/quinone reductase family protein [Streptomyces sp. NPDC057307]|uniref:nitroreductase/quinone reductase family protein n=1 Tax=Streptomyces sp. NPDC057307 TaxID=3346096 RepID=UPI003628FE98
MTEPEQRQNIQEFNRLIIEEFRANGGRVGGMFEGAPLVLLTTLGARSGKRRTNPAAYARDGERLLVFASNAGAPVHPGWYFNLLADNRVTVEIGTVEIGAEEGGAGEGGIGEGGAEERGVRTFSARAEPLQGEERDHQYALQAARDPGFAAYQAGTDRTIPVIALYPLTLTDPARNRAIGEELVRVHAQLRAELTALRATPASPSSALDEGLLLHCLSFCESLSMHHTAEDGAFSAFDRQFPELAPVLERLRTEHRAVSVALTKLRADPPATSEALRQELERLAKDLDEHFTYEETHLLPALNGYPADAPR